MDQQYRFPADGRCVRPVFERTWHRYDSNGRILSVCCKSVYCHAIYGMGVVVFDYDMAIVPCVRRTHNRSREPFVTDGKKRFIWAINRICKANIPADA